MDVKKLKVRADIECYIYSYKDYVRLLCDMRRRMVDKATPRIAREDSLYAEALKLPHADSVYLDEMKAEIIYCRAMWAHAQGRSADAEKAFAEYLSTQTAKQLGSIINSCRYLMATGRYEEAARNMTQLDVFMGENGYQPDLENIGRFMIPKFHVNLLAGHRDSAPLTGVARGRELCVQD